jgi:long-chain fatty acid transport protein
MFGGVMSGEFKADSDEKVYLIPAIGVSVPITRSFPLWRFGLAAYGVTGLGVDYRETMIEQDAHYDFTSSGMGVFPLMAGEFTQLQIMKFSPSIAYQPNEKFSVGLGLHVDYSALDLRQGSSFNYGFGVQVGTLFKVSDSITLGATYISEQNVTHENVNDFDGDGVADDLDLASPQQFGVGIAFQPTGSLLIELDGKWINWSSADGYEDFDWDDQWIIAVGAQFDATDKLVLRCGWNYGKSVLNEHNGFVGASSTPPPPMTEIQGKFLPTWYYETFRIVGFPAVVEHHLTLGMGYDITDTMSLNLSYMHAFEKTVTESGVDIAGQMATLESTLSEDSLDFSFTWRF